MAKEESEKRAKFKGPLLVLRTERFLALYDRLGRLGLTRSSSWILLYLMPIVAALGIFFIFFALSTMLGAPESREVSRQLGPQAFLLIPGLNPLVPIVYGWVGIVVGLIVHEGAHGIVARSLGVQVKASGLLFFLIIPIGAFVEVDEEKLKDMRARDSGRVLAAGPGANIIVAAMSLALMLLVVSTITPVSYDEEGIILGNVHEDFPAWEAGLRRGDMILEVDGVRTRTIEDLTEALESKQADDSVSLTVIGGQDMVRRGHLVRLASSTDGPKLGVNAIPTSALAGVLDFYREVSFTNPTIHFIPPTLVQGLIPFSDALFPFYTSSLGGAFYPLANMFYWIWFININLAIFNSLPLGPLDGGRAFTNLLRKTVGRGWKEQGLTIVSGGVTLTILSAILLMVLIPYLI